MKVSNLSIEKKSIHGHGIAQHEGDDIHILGAYTGDVVDASIYKKAYGISYAELNHIQIASPHRSYTPTTPPFYISHAPWLYLSSESEQMIKRDLVNALFPQTKEIEPHPTLRTNYRNKGSYSFTTTKGILNFAHYKRGKDGGSTYVQEENILVHPKITKAANVFLNFFRQQKISSIEINYLIIRYSYFSDTVSVQILVPSTTRKLIPWKKSALENIFLNHSFISGILVSQSPADTRSTLSTQDYYHLGEINITEKIDSMFFSYHPSSFFQIYPEAFESITSDIYSILDMEENMPERTLIDLFSGVGVIGLSLANIVARVVAVEHSKLSKLYSEDNARANEIKNFTCHECSVDDALDDIDTESVVVVDPPRSGLTKKVIEVLQNRKPKYIVYISCNPLTQYEDIQKVHDGYTLLFSKAYNLFPSTPHIEHLVILRRI